MTNSQLKRAPAKLLLFGEYTILSGSNALALPLFEFYGEWTTDLVPGISVEKQQGRLRELAENETLRALDFMDFDLMLTDLDHGYWIRSNIPSGYGLGSSGVVTALIYDKYCTSPEQALYVLRERLAKIESFFHGSSSGIDPLTSYLAKPIVVNGLSEEIQLPEMKSKLDYHIYLLDSGRKRNTAQLVQTYKTKVDSDENMEFAVENLTDLAQNTIYSFLTKNARSHFPESIKELSKLQLKIMQPDWIPDDIRKLWEAGLANDQYQMKLCGAGGGGFFLVFSSSELPNMLGGFALTKVY